MQKNTNWKITTYNQKQCVEPALTTVLFQFRKINWKCVEFLKTLFTLVNVRPREEVSILTHDYSTFQPGKYIACLYDGAWYVGYIRNRSEEHKDIEVEFMNRKGDAVSWPADTRSMCHGYHFKTYFAPLRFLPYKAAVVDNTG